ncbi:MAG: hypothetical protein KF746_22555 [Chitinophagaceae bacterium]|nr:hypothetical protein [Chitinophagaceae bacterium]
MKAMTISAFFIALLAFTSEKKLAGRWESKRSEKGNITGVVFKEDGSFEGYINKKPFVSGNYELQDSTFSFTDNGCNGAKGIYIIHFFSNNDSIRFEPVEDTCAERNAGMSRLILGRIKK